MNTFDTRCLSRLAGMLYAVIIICGLWSELAVRSALIVPGDAASTAFNILAHEGLFRLSLAADAVMALADIGVAVLLFGLLRPAGPLLAGTAAALRLVQTAIIGASLVHQHAALSILQGAGHVAFTPQQREALAMASLETHALGYDLGLIFFGVACLLYGGLILRSRLLPRWLGMLVAAAGLVYLAGSFTRLLAPGALGLVQPAYIVPMAAEIAFCLWLVIRGVGTAQSGEPTRMNGAQ